MEQETWYNNAIIYALDAETYMDGNGDGTGDLEGLGSRLDYLAGLGVNCVWLRPFFPSPLKDDGYDVQDYYAVDKRLGTLGIFVDLMERAKATGIRIIIDIVANHTSDQHEWFLESRKDKNSKYRDYYIWAEKPERKSGQRNLLGEGGVWQYDEVAGAYYLHHFKKEQPDLNISNPAVTEEIKRVMGFWLKLGVSGFRVDAAHILVKEVSGRGAVKQQELVSVLEDLRKFICQRNSEAVLLAEANVPVKKLNSFFANGTRMDLLFNFACNQHLFLALAREDPAPLIRSLKDIQEIRGQWVNFLRLHDELNLEILSDKEREEIFRKFAPGKEMRIFGHGIRRRLPPMLEGDRRKLEFLYAVMFSLPGIPMINYGEEIMMGDDLSREGRLSVRTIMQWDNSKNAGFSESDNILPGHSLIEKGKYGYKKINVAAQQKNARSFLNWMERLISTRKQCPQLSYGKWEFIEHDAKMVLAFYCEWENDIIVVLHNFSSRKCRFKITTGKKFGKLTTIFSNSPLRNSDDVHKGITLGPFGYSWMKSDNYQTEK